MIPVADGRFGALPTVVGPRTIPGSFQDVNGHVNVRHHFDLILESIKNCMAGVGLNDDYAIHAHHGFFTVEQHVQFHSEVHVGDTVRTVVVVRGRGRRAIHGMCLLVNETNGSVATSAEFTTVHVDLDQRATVDFPAHIAAEVDRAIDQSGADELDLPWCGAMGIRERSGQPTGAAT